MLFSLQRSAGNRAVAALARGGGPKLLPVQRREFGAGEGYHDAKPGGNDDRPTVIGAIHRIPVDRLKHGYAGKGTDPRTIEHADHRAIVLVPDGLNLDRTIDLMVHFHGLSSALTTAGWRETKEGKVADEAVDHIEGQMEAIGNSQLVAILPEGVDKDFGDALSRDSIDEVLGRVFPAYTPGGGKASKPPSYQLILSAHSGGGDYQVGMQAVKAENDRAAGLKPSPSNPAAGLQEAHAIILFEGMYPGTEEQVWTWIKRHLDETAKVLVDPSSTPASRAAALERCPIFRGYISDHPVPVYKKTYAALKSSIDGWFAGHGSALRPDDAKALGDHFAVSVVPDTNHLNLVRGGDRDAAAGPLADALRAVHHPETHAVPGHGGVPAEKTQGGAGHATPARTSKSSAPAKAKSTTKHASAGVAQEGPVDDNPILSSALGDVVERVRYKGVLQDVDLTAFRRAVYDAERAIYLGLGMHPVPNLAKGEVDDVLGIPVRKLIKADLVDLLDAARKARDAAAAGGDQLARGCTHIGIGSGYRTKEEDFGAWKTTFLKSLGRTQKAREALWHAKSPKDPIGPEAVALMAENMHAFKATPGFSNHSRGLAVDFTTTQDRVELSASVAQNDLWDASWFHQWLAADDDANAHRFRFHRLKTERWHWDHEAGVPADPAAPDHSGGGGGAGAIKRPPTVTQPKPPDGIGASGSPDTAAAHHAPKDQSPVGGAPPGGSTGDKTKQPVGGPTISWGAHAKRDVVTPATLEVLSDVLRAAGLHKATITSTMRTPVEQARVMYDNLVAHGIKSQRRLYGAGGRAVIEVYETQTAAGAAKADVIAAMLAKINDLGPYKVSHHCGDPSVLNVIDVGPASLGDNDAIARFEAAARADRRIARIFTPNQGDPGEHLEIPTGGGGVATGGSGSVHTPQPHPETQPTTTPTVTGSNHDSVAPAGPTGHANATATPTKHRVTHGPTPHHPGGWVDVLPHNHRGKGQHLSKVKGELSIDKPVVALPTITADQQAVLESIRAARAKLPAISADWGTAQGNKGYKLHDSVPATETATPAELLDPATPGVSAKRLVWDEVRKEGGLDSINTYDSEIVTWGKGFSAKSGSMNEVLLDMFQSDPAAEQMLMGAGIALDANTWYVVDTSTGWVEVGNDALRLLQLDRSLLQIFVRLGSDPDHASHALEAQWAWVKRHAAGDVPQFAWSWSPDAIKLVAHLMQWMPGSNWRNVDWSSTGGDVLAIAKRFARWLAKRTPSGALVVSSGWDYLKPGHRLDAFADGIGMRVIKAANFPVLKLSEHDLATDQKLAGHVLVSEPEAVYSTRHGKKVVSDYRYGDQYLDLGA
jgi:hypothetical protein